MDDFDNLRTRTTQGFVKKNASFGSMINHSIEQTLVIQNLCKVSASENTSNFLSNMWKEQG